MLPCPGSNLFVLFFGSDSCVYGCYVYPSTENIFVVSEVLLEKCGNRKGVRALLHALPALHAFLYLRHHCLTFGTELALGWGTSYKLHHSCALIDLYSLRARHTVAAASAESGGEFLPVGVDYFLEFGIERRRIGIVTEPFVMVGLFEMALSKVSRQCRLFSLTFRRPWSYIARDITQEKS